jgi:hypothetical protein
MQAKSNAENGKETREGDESSLRNPSDIGGRAYLIEVWWMSL